MCRRSRVAPEDLPASKKRKLENGEEVADEAEGAGEEVADGEQGDVEMNGGEEAETASDEAAPAEEAAEPKDGETPGTNLRLPSPFIS